MQLVYYLFFYLLDIVFKYYVWNSEKFWTPTFTHSILKYYYWPIDQNFGDNEPCSTICKKFKSGGMFDFYCNINSKKKAKIIYLSYYNIIQYMSKIQNLKPCILLHL